MNDASWAAPASNRSLVWAGVTAAATLSVGAATLYGVHGRGSQLFGNSVYRGHSGRKSLALTFDDGPSPGTLELADYLAEQGIQATFFQCGMNILRHPDITDRLHSAGHEIGNHTFSHTRLCPRLGWKPNLLSPKRIYEEFASTQQMIRDHSGARPRFLRAPYGLRWFGVAAAQRRLNLLGVMWTSIGHDWSWDPQRITHRVVSQATPGGIICLHDGRDTRPNPDISATLEAVKRIVPRLKDQGFQFETVSQILMPQL